MPVTPPRNTTSPNQALRASLLAPDGVVRPAAEAPAAAVDLRLPDLSTSLLPTAPELLEASPNLQRLCESYHRTYRHMLARNRRQRLGLAMLVAAVGAAAVALSQSHAATVAVASSLVVAVGAASALGVALLALLWVRDDRRLRRV
ncbi:MAG: hypothetical protein E6I76_19060, partial [Chloroflexi bacterium]